MTVALRSLVATVRASGGVDVVAAANSPDSIKVLTATATADAIAMSVTALAAAMAQLTTDAASPTQAHCTTAVNAWNTLAALIVTAKASAAAADAAAGTVVTNNGHTVTVTFDATDISDSGKLRAAFNEIIRGAFANGIIRM
jgi:3-methyladenine DNA glycosylase/8-oxoguanine DNA glycosylase